MKIQFQEGNGPRIRLYVPMWLAVRLLKRWLKLKSIDNVDLKRLEKVLHQYKGTVLMEAHGKDGSKIKIRL